VVGVRGRRDLRIQKAVLGSVARRQEE